MSSLSPSSLDTQSKGTSAITWKYWNELLSASLAQTRFTRQGRFFLCFVKNWCLAPLRLVSDRLSK